MGSVHGRRWRWTVMLVTAALCIVLLMFSGIIAWTPLNSLYQDVDIRTGRMRDTRCLLYYRVNQQIRDSAITLALGPQDLASQVPDWRRVNTLSPPMTRYSPHHAFHAAIHQISQIEDAWQIATFSSEAKRDTARTLLALWQKAGSDSTAKDYVRSVYELAVQHHNKPTEAILSKDLPQPSEERVATRSMPS